MSQIEVRGIPPIGADGLTHEGGTMVFVAKPIFTNGKLTALDFCMYAYRAEIEAGGLTYRSQPIHREADGSFSFFIEPTDGSGPGIYGQPAWPMLETESA